jgi:hypothetical protein
MFVSRPAVSKRPRSARDYSARAMLAVFVGRRWVRTSDAECEWEVWRKASCDAIRESRIASRPRHKRRGSVFNHRIRARTISYVIACEVPIAALLPFIQLRQKREVGFGKMPPQRTPATRRGEQASSKLSDGQAFNPTRSPRPIRSYGGLETCANRISVEITNAKVNHRFGTGPLCS